MQTLERWLPHGARRCCGPAQGGRPSRDVTANGFWDAGVENQHLRTPCEGEGSLVVCLWVVLR